MPQERAGPRHSSMDLHVHSTCSGDGRSSIIDHARQARSIGLAAVGFCEHADFDPRERDYEHLDLARYDQELAAARDHVPEVLLLQAVEITYQAAFEGHIRNWLSQHPWDYVIASVHMVDYDDGWTILSEPRAVEDYFDSHTCRQAYVPYFDELLRAARSGLGDVLGHIDLVKRYGTSWYGPFDPRAFSAEIRAVLRAAIEAGMGLEINTSGLRQPPGETYPGLEVLRWYRDLGGEILTVGSDAHHIQELGAAVRQALDLARSAGFRAVACYRNRQVRWVDL